MSARAKFKLKIHLTHLIVTPEMHVSGSNMSVEEADDELVHLVWKLLLHEMGSIGQPLNL